MKAKITILSLMLAALFCSAVIAQEQKIVAVATFDIMGNAVTQDEADGVFATELRALGAQI